MLQQLRETITARHFDLACHPITFRRQPDGSCTPVVAARTCRDVATLRQSRSGSRWLAAPEIVVPEMLYSPPCPI